MLSMRLAAGRSALGQSKEGSNLNYIPHTASDAESMLAAIGVVRVEDLFVDIPVAIRDPEIRLPRGVDEPGLRRHLQVLAFGNRSVSAMPSFLGAGAYHHHVPSVVRYLLSRGEFITPYTPYQPEVSQGTLQAIFEFQSLMCRLTGMEVANASLYDGATAAAEAAAMALHFTRRSGVVTSGLNPQYTQVLRTYFPGSVSVVEAGQNSQERRNGVVFGGTVADLVDQDTACVVVQNPNFFGCLEDVALLAEVAHNAGALLVVCAYPIALALLDSPGALGADIVIGEGQPLGIPLSFGGPYLGFLTTRNKFMRLMPGRVVGQAQDNRGQTGYILTMQAREQHIRRERAGSNMCTNEALCALAATIYLSALGPQGLISVASACLAGAHYAAALIGALPGFRLAFPEPFFNEFVVRCPVPAAQVNAVLLNSGILGGYDLGLVDSDLAACLLLCVTEMNTRGEIDRLVAALGTIGNTEGAT